MADRAEISRGAPACFIFLLDQSGSMADQFGSEAALRKVDFVSDVVNRTLHDIVSRCTRTEEIRNSHQISVIGYATTVGPAFSGALACRSHVPVAEVADMPARVENRTKKISDGAGGPVDQQVRFPVWMDPVSNGGTPMSEAFNLVSNLVDQWLTEHRNSFLNAADARLLPVGNRIAAATVVMTLFVLETPCRKRESASDTAAQALASAAMWCGALFRSWADGSEGSRVVRHADYFNHLWSGRVKDVRGR